MATFKNCEEYVLAELERKEAELEAINKEVEELRRAVDYGNRAIGVLQQLNEITWKEGKDAEGKEGKFLCITPTKGTLKLDMENPDDRYVYELLAPLIGDEEIKAKHRESLNAEAAEEAAKKKEA